MVVVDLIHEFEKNISRISSLKLVLNSIYFLLSMTPIYGRIWRMKKRNEVYTAQM